MLFRLVSEVAALIVVARIMHELLFRDAKSQCGKSRVIRILTIIAIFIVSVVAAAVFGLNTAFSVSVYRRKPPTRNFIAVVSNSYIVYEAFYTLCTILLFITALSAITRKQRKVGNLHIIFH